MTRRSTLVLLAALVAWTLLACGWSAGTGLYGGRFYDERFSVRNATEVLTKASLQPNNAWYASLSYLPQAAILAGSQGLYRLTGLESLEVIDDEERFTDTGYLLARWFSVLCGAASVLMVFLIGRRLFSPEVGLLAAALFAACPANLRAFVEFKPDALHLLLTLVAFQWCLDVGENPSLRRYLIAGLGVGLATAAKYTGALTSMPLVVTTLLNREQWRLGARRLVVAGVTSVGVFLLLHPYLPFYLAFFNRSLTIYSTKGGFSFGGMLLRQTEYLLEEAFHGPLIGSIALIGFALLCVRLMRLRGDGVSFRQLAMFISFPLGYSIVYAMVTQLPKGNNYLALVPFTALAAAWLLARCWNWVAERLSPVARRLVFWPSLLSVALVAGWPAHAFVYREAVTQTALDRAADAILATTPFVSPRTAVFEEDVGQLDVRSRVSSSARDFMAAWRLEALSDWPEAVLDKLDYEVFGEDRLHGPRRDFYLRRMLRLPPGAVDIVRPEWFKARGTSQVVLRHPWYPVGGALPVEWKEERRKKGLFSGRLPDGLVAGQVVSIHLVVPHGDYRLETFGVGSLELEPVWNGWDEVGARFMTQRFQLHTPSLKIRLRWRGSWDAPEAPRVYLWRWTDKPPTSRRRRGSRLLESGSVGGAQARRSATGLGDEEGRRPNLEPRPRLEAGPGEREGGGSGEDG